MPPTGDMALFMGGRFLELEVAQLAVGKGKLGPDAFQSGTYGVLTAGPEAGVARAVVRAAYEPGWGCAALNDACNQRLIT